MRIVHTTRYVTPLREGGSMPAIVEADDDGTYVLKFRGAGQGLKVLIAELISGEIARLLGFRVPELVFMELDPVLGRTEPDPEIQALIQASGGLNLGLDYLPGSITFDPLAPKSLHTEVELASGIVWLDAYLTNVDRTPRNANMLVWHQQLWLIDHGASLYFHHSWQDYLTRSRSPFAAIKDHVLLPFARDIAAADARLAPQITPAAIAHILALIPDAWLGTAPFTDAESHRAAYAEYLLERLSHRQLFVEEADRAHRHL